MVIDKKRLFRIFCIFFFIISVLCLSIYFVLKTSDNIHVSLNDKIKLNVEKIDNSLRNNSTQINAVNLPSEQGARVEWILSDAVYNSENKFVTEPIVKVDISNTSTPGISLFASFALKERDGWKNILTNDSLVMQNLKMGTTQIKSVIPGSMGNGKSGHVVNEDGTSNYVEYTYNFEIENEKIDVECLKSVENTGFVVTLTTK